MDATPVPAGFKITLCPARVAKGARKPRFGGRGDGPSVMGAARATSVIAGLNDRKSLLAYAATSTINRSA